MIKNKKYVFIFEDYYIFEMIYWYLNENFCNVLKMYEV